MTVWFTSDTHFGHANIIRLAGRPFKDVYDMDKTLIANWNRRVKPNDIVIVVGDFAYRSRMPPEKYVGMLHGNITFIHGNHDNLEESQDDETVKEFRRPVEIHSLVVNIGDQDVFCTHEPVNFSSAYSLNLVGHIHEKWKVKKLYRTFLVNVGVDVWDFRPVTIDDIIERRDAFEKRWQANWERRYGRKRR